MKYLISNKDLPILGNYFKNYVYDNISVAYDVTIAFM